MRIVAPLLTVGCAVFGCQNPSPPTADVVLKDVTVVDVQTGSRRPGQDIFIEGRHITATLPTVRSNAPPGALVIEASGQFVIPGLWDMHVHSAASAAWHFPIMLAHGILGVRNMHSTVPHALELTDSIRAGVASGSILGPRFVANGPIIDGDPSPWSGAVIIRTEAEARSAVDSLVAGGAEFLKVYDNLTVDLFMAVLDQARGHGIPVDGHMPFAVPPTDGATAGLRTIEHLSGMTMGCSSSASDVRAEFARLMTRSPLPFPEGELAYFGLIRRASDGHDERLCRATVEAYQKAGVAVAPTLIIQWAQNNAAAVISDSRAMGLLPPALREQWSFMAGPGPGEMFASIMAPVYDAVLERLRMLHAAGVPLLAGTDVGNPFVVPGRSLHDELAIFVDVGLTPLEALQTATLNPARVLGVRDSLGAVAVGYVADLVLLGADPVADIESVRLIKGVVRAGRYYGKSQLDDLIAEALEGERGSSQ